MTEDLWQKRLDREKQRVLALEQIIEDKTRQLYLANQELRQHNEHLEGLVQERTADLRHALEDAEAASRAKTEFVAHMSHELRTPMHGLSGTIDELTRTALNDQQRSLVGLCQESSARLLTVIGEVLDFSRIEAGKLELDMKPACLQSIIEDAAASFASSIAQKGLGLTTEVFADDPVWIMTDAHALSQILSNLLSNAVKFTDQGGISIQVKVTPVGARVRTNWVVKDTGCGMTEASASNVFSPFKQADAGITRRYGGTGLGLSIVKGLVEALGGSIEVASEAGKGTEFRLVIEHDRTGPRVAAANDGVGEDLAILDGKQVLIVDDHPINRTLCEVMLRDSACELFFAADASEAFAQVEQHQPDLILMDCHMSDMSGIEVSRRLRQQGFKSPILAVSADATLNNVNAVADAGMQGLLCKPFRRAELFEAIANSFGMLEHVAESASQADTAAEPLFSVDSALELLDGDQETLVRLCEVFVAELPRAIASVVEAITKADSEAQRRAAHSLKGAASIVSATCLEKMSARLEASAAEGKPATCSVEEVEAVAAATEAEIRQYLQ